MLKARTSPSTPAARWPRRTGPSSDSAAPSRPARGKRRPPMRADNTRHIIDAARHRHELTRAKAIQALRTVDAAGTPVTFETVARAAVVSRSWLYAQPDIRAEIERLRTASR